MFGIDFGTTQTKAAYIDSSGNPCIVLNGRGDPHTPSIVHVGETGEVLVGADAKEQGYVDPERCLRGFKLELGSNESLLNNGTVFTATDAAAAVIAYQKEAMEKATGKKMDCCVSTCPANFRDDQKQALLEAHARSGIEVLALIPEPTAGAIAYQLAKGRDKATFLTFDFGGGTLDVSLLQSQGDQLTVLATHGVPRLGGNDLDECIRKFIIPEVAAKLGKEPTRASHPLFFQDLDQRVPAAKLSLNKRHEVPIVASVDGVQVIVKIRQADYRSDIDPLIDQSLQAIDKALAGAAMDTSAVDCLVMLGGTSRDPHIQERVANHTGLVPKTDIDPEKAIAYGAALACLTEMVKRGDTPVINGQVIPAPDLFVQDVTAHGVGCCVVDTSKSKRRLANAVLIKQNTPIPCRNGENFYLEHPDQTAVRIEVLQGPPDADRDDCLLIGEFSMENLPTESVQTARIHVEYTIDGNGMVTATATDKISGKQQTVSVDYKRGVKPKDSPQAA